MGIERYKVTLASASCRIMGSLKIPNRHPSPLAAMTMTTIMTMGIEASRRGAGMRLMGSMAVQCGVDGSFRWVDLSISGP
jgi:hypothetical protein